MLNRISLDYTKIVGRAKPTNVEEMKMTREEFYKVYESHLNDTTRDVELRDGYEVHYPNGDIYRYKETLIPGRAPSSWSGSYFSDDFVKTSYWNNELITV